MIEDHTEKLKNYIFYSWHKDSGLGVVNVRRERRHHSVGFDSLLLTQFPLCHFGVSLRGGIAAARLHIWV